MCMDEMKIIRQWFKDYHKWKIKAARLKPRQRAIRITGLPKSKPADPDSKMIQYTNATNECQQRLDLLKMMIDTEKNGKLYADIIEKRYLRRWTVVKTMDYLEEHYNLYLSRRTLMRYEYEGLQLALDLVK